MLITNQKYANQQNKKRMDKNQQKKKKKTRYILQTVILKIILNINLLLQNIEEMIVKSSYFKKQFDVNKAQLIGQGNFAQVYRVFHPETQNYLAIRRVDRDLGQSEDIQKQKTINQELRRVENQNILQIFDIIQTSTCIWYITQYCQGGSLWDVLNTCQDNKMNEKDALECVYQISKGVKQLHNHRITHRDLKPENILLKTKYVPNKPMPIIKIADFGLSTKKIIMQTIAGTKQYIAPEQARFHNYTNAVDVWSLGIIFDQILHGTPFYVGQNNKQVFQKIVKNPYKVRDSSIRNSIQQFLISVLKKKAYERPIIAVICQCIQKIQQQIKKQKGQKEQSGQKNTIPSFEKKNIRSVQALLPDEIKSTTSIPVVPTTTNTPKQAQSTFTRQISANNLLNIRQNNETQNSHGRAFNITQSNPHINTNNFHNVSQNAHNNSSLSINSKGNSNPPNAKVIHPVFNGDDKASNKKQQRKAKTPFKRQNGRPQFFKTNDQPADVSPSISALRDRRVILTDKKQGQPQLRKKQLNKQVSKQVIKEAGRDSIKQTPIQTQRQLSRQQTSKQRIRQLSKDVSRTVSHETHQTKQIQQQKQNVNNLTQPRQKQVEDVQKQKLNIYKVQKRKMQNLQPRPKQLIPQFIDVKDYMQSIIKLKSDLGQSSLQIAKQRQFIINSQLTINEFPNRFDGQEVLKKYRKNYQFLNYIAYNQDYQMRLSIGKNNLGDNKSKAENEMNEYKQKIKKCFQAQIQKYVDVYVQKTIK